ncbi:hypothetical protein [Tautonia marina]|uniref:hypothetical protein n=1 Tax=Tautonia marina TaxID=2653855 RepID=UPI0012604EFF|nr:hypothetical protein [Tautonia marina]
MKTERSASTGPPARRASPRLALILMALAAISLEGCQSLQSINPFRNCVGCGPLSRIGSGGGLFNRNRGRIVYEEPPIILDSAPGVEVLPGEPAIIQSTPPVGSTLVPADPALTTPPTSIRPPDDNTLELEPLPEPSGRAPQGSGTPRASADRTLGSRPIDRASTTPTSTGDSFADRMARRSSDEARPRFGFDPAPEPGRGVPLPAPSSVARTDSRESLRVIDRLPAPESIGPDESDDLAPPPPVEPKPETPSAEPTPQPAPAAPVVEPTPEPAPAAPVVEPTPEPETPPAVGQAIEPEPVPAADHDLSPPAVVEPMPPPFAEPTPAPVDGAGLQPLPDPAPPAVAEPELPTPTEPIEPPPDPPAVSEPTTQVIPESPPDIGGTSGIGAFYSVAPLLAGGAIPEESGWTWLADHGYRTVLDLRPVDQIRPTDFASSNRLGLRHVLLPMTPGTIDATLVNRFEEEIALESARPLYFCDTDGSAAAVLWYIHRIKVDRSAPERARRDAERIAPISPSLMLAAQAFLNGQPLAAQPEPEIPALVLETEYVVETELSPTEPSPESAEPSAVHDPTTVVVEGSAAPADTDSQPPIEPEPATTSPVAEASIAEVFDDPFAKSAPVDPKSWGPYAAFFLTILAIPLAYWGSSNLPTGFRTRVRASLTGPARQPASLPQTSDA